MRNIVRNLQESRIREVANAGIGRSDVLPFWFGESDEVTPDVIRQAAIASLERGETFYAHNLGLAELREAISGTTPEVDESKRGGLAPDVEAKITPEDDEKRVLEQLPEDKDPQLQAAISLLTNPEA